VVAAGSLNQLTSATGDFVNDGVEEGHYLKVASAYHKITGVAAGTITIGADMTAGTSLAFRAVEYPQILDLTDTDKAICFIELFGAVSEAKVQFFVEVVSDGQAFYRIGDEVTATNTVGNVATVIEHGGSYVWARLSSITGVSDVATDYVNLTLRGFQKR